MAISPPSDILLDVAGAADPTKLREATARLAQLAADPGAANVGFSDALARARTNNSAVATASAAAIPDSAPPPFDATTFAQTRPLDARKSMDPYRKYEAVLLQSFVECMLPKDDDVFGDKESAGVYRSMMAEQLANQMADSGGIGLAKAMAAAHPAAHQTQPDGKSSS